MSEKQAEKKKAVERSLAPKKPERKRLVSESDESSESDDSSGSSSSESLPKKKLLPKKAPRLTEIKKD
jgi:hypothetical protein